MKKEINIFENIYKKDKDFFYSLEFLTELFKFETLEKTEEEFSEFEKTYFKDIEYISQKDLISFIKSNGMEDDFKGYIKLFETGR